MNEDFVKRVINKLPLSEHIALDIGAWHGEYSLLLAKKHRHVYAFEPFPENVDALYENVKDILNISIVTKAVNSQTGPIKLYPCPSNTGGNTISELIAERDDWGHSLDNFIEVDGISIDDFVNKNKVSTIKMDIEGAENFAWLGAVNTLKHNKLYIILEIHQGVDCKALFEFFKKRNFTVIGENRMEVDHFENDKHYFLYNGWAIHI